MSISLQSTTKSFGQKKCECIRMENIPKRRISFAALCNNNHLKEIANWSVSDQVLASKKIFQKNFD